MFAHLRYVLADRDYCENIVGRKPKYAPGEAPTAVERSADYVVKLRESGGKRRSYNWRSNVAAALDVLKASNEHCLQDETAIISELIIKAAARISKASMSVKKTKSK